MAVAEDLAGEPDLQMIVVRDRGRSRLIFSLTARDRRLGLNRKRFESPPFERDPEAWFQDLFRDLEGPVCATRLAGIGSQLAKELFSPDLQRCLGALAGRVGSVELLSEEPWIPWELVRLRTGEESPVRRFLCEMFAMTRWIDGPSEVRRFPLRKMAVSILNDEDLPGLAEERELLLGFARDGREVVEVPATLSEIRGALATGAWDSWHFAGHGTGRSDNPNRRGLRLEEGELLTPRDLHALDGALQEKRPLIFLNACSALRGGVSLTGVAGLAEQFLEEGAGAVVGTRWGVPDSQAAAFAKSFYSLFLTGTPLGEAVRQSRLELRNQFPSDAAWLAYAAYGHPFAVGA